MKLLIDTNVVLDVLLRREPFCDAAAEVLSMAQRENIREYVSASAITDIYYIASRQIKDRTAAREFEDSVQYSVALLNEMDAIVTRNPNDYRQSDISVYLPEDILSKFSGSM